MEKAWWETIDYSLSEKEQKAVDNLSKEVARRIQFFQEVQTILFLASYL
jgi:ABC-type uncharacterized transport system ATPase subunit